MIETKAYFPVLIVDDLAECKKFFTEVFGFDVAFDTDWYVHLVLGGVAQLGFLVPNHPSQPADAQRAFNAQGLIYSFEVENVDSAFESVRGHAEIIAPPKTEEWGQRHFLVSAPGGLLVDVIQNVDSSLDAT
ncbi:hypothetical protein SAMN05216326_11361 [Nitrosomonas marina]|uniref:VOC domain-containing protein n=1 Tax=Nitrosomonas marina TaxID=917 RepID=A0A1I0C6U0_9PROT|nr:VOC family protein [Nitrosomonas marina]SET15229.1 hypothetical protein SAMN05216326_11361 [Nitrosomonas marina]